MISVSFLSNMLAKNSKYIFVNICELRGKRHDLPGGVKSEFMRNNIRTALTPDYWSLASAPLLLTCYAKEVWEDAKWADRQPSNGYEIGLAVYGLQCYVHLTPKSGGYGEENESIVLYMMRDKSRRERFLIKLRKVGVTDCKLVHKRPYRYAAQGPKTMVKLYVNRTFTKAKLVELVAEERNSLKEAEQEEEIDTRKLTLSQRILINCQLDERQKRKRSETALPPLNYEYLHDSRTGVTEIFLRRKKCISLGELRLRGGADVYHYENGTKVYPMHVNNVMTDSEHELPASMAMAVFWQLITEAQQNSDFKQVVSAVYDSWKRHTGIKLSTLPSTVSRLQFKEAVASFLKGMLRSSTDSFLEAFCPRINGGSPEKHDENLSNVYRTFAILAGIVRRTVKRVWRMTTEQLAKCQDRWQHIHKRLNVLVIDCETDWVKQSFKSSAITLITCEVVCPALRPNPSLATVAFFRLPPGRVADPNLEELVKNRFSEIKARHPPRSDCTGFFEHIENTPFKVVFLKNEADLLIAFTAYVRLINPAYIVHYNGDRFDVPLLLDRMQYWGVCGAKGKKEEGLGSKQIRTIPFSLRGDDDRTEFRYEPPAKKHNFARSVWQTEIESMKSQTRQGGGRVCEWDYKEGDSDSDILVSDEEKVEDEEVCRQNIQCQPFMGVAKTIASVISGRFGMVDLMKYGDNPSIKYMSLDAMAAEVLGVRKLGKEEDKENPENDYSCVHYAELAETWEKGDIVKWSKFVAYGMWDTMITTRIMLQKDMCHFLYAMALTAGIVTAEVSAKESMKRMVVQVGIRGNEDDIVTPDPSVGRREAKLWKPGYEFDSVRDYEHLRPLAGRTVPDVFGVCQTPCVTLDFSSQYPSIMQAFNICLSSMLTLEYIRENKLVEGEDYIHVKLTNVRPVVDHRCPKDRTKCGLRTGKSKDCVLSVTFEKVNYDVYFATKKIFRSLMGTASEFYSTERQKFKQRMKTFAEGSPDWRRENQNQFVVKERNNSLYGTMTKLCSIVGDTITNLGRQQAETLAKKGLERGLKVVNGDTDSAFIQLIPNVCPTMGDLARELDMSQLPKKEVTVVKLIKALMYKGEVFSNACNQGLFPKPCRVELEKIFPFSITNYAKKHYIGLKVIPGSYDVKYHASGVTGIKSDTSRLKTAVQLGSDRLVVRQDYVGVIDFLIAVFSVCGVDITRVNSRWAAIEELANGIPNDEKAMMDVKYADTRKECQVMLEALNADCGSCALYSDDLEGHENFLTSLPCEWYEGIEKVGHILMNGITKTADGRPIPFMTMATKRARTLVKINGEAVTTAPQRIPVIRAASVQIRSSALKLLNILLVRPSSHEDMQLISGTRKRKLTSKLVDGLNAKRRRLCVNRAQAKEEMSRIGITAMPEKYRINTAEATVKLDPKIVTKAHIARDILEAINFESQKCDANILKKWRANVTPRNVKRLADFIAGFNQVDPFPPLKMLAGFALDTISDLQLVSKAEDNVAYALPSTSSSCDLWAIHIGLGRIYNWTTIYRKEGTTLLRFCKEKPEADRLLGPSMWSWDIKNNAINLSHDCCVLVDLRSYEVQTSATPIVAGTCQEGMQYVVNVDGYREEGSEDFFSFTFSQAELAQFTNEKEVPSTRMAVIAGEGASQGVTSSYRNRLGMILTRQWRSAKPWRVDGHRVTCWPQDRKVALRTADLCMAANKLYTAARHSKDRLLFRMIEPGHVCLSDINETERIDIWERGTKEPYVTPRPVIPGEAERVMTDYFSHVV